MPKITTTNQLTQYALKVIRRAGFHAWRQNNGAVWDAKNKTYRKGSSTPGVADIIGFHRQTGQFIACEIKVGRDTLRREQVLFHAAVRGSGGLSLIVGHADDLQRLAATHHLPLPTNEPIS